MSRRREAEKRERLPDPKYGDKVLAKFINTIMRNGKKSTAERIVYGALSEIAKSNDEATNPLAVFKGALEKIQPLVEVKSRRVGGATYQVPIEVRPERSQTLAMRWLVAASKKRNEKNMGLCLAKELMEAVEEKGSAIKKREDTHRMAEANKAFSHFRW
ncbi:MAG: 30S ribosomal protein S7 [Candidatus Eutrophobiaceae bacterium]